MSRNSIRAAIFNERVVKVVVALDNGEKIEIRDGNVGDMLDAISVQDVKQRMARMLINCCYVPDTEERIFEESDFDSLMALPSNGTYQKVMEVINSRININTKVDEEEKD